MTNPRPPRQPQEAAMTMVFGGMPTAGKLEIMRALLVSTHEHRELVCRVVEDGD
jgi:hypothetical protein